MLRSERSLLKAHFINKTRFAPASLLWEWEANSRWQSSDAYV